MSAIWKFLPAILILLMAATYVLMTRNSDTFDPRYCADENRRLSDEELVERIMAGQIRSRAAGSGVPQSLQGQDSGYETYSDLIQANPDCCAFREITTADPPAYRAAQKEHGAVGYVSYRYVVPYLKAGQQKYHQRGPATVLVSACGKRVSK